MIRQRGQSWQVDLRIAGQRVREDYPTQVEAVEREAELKVSALKGMTPVAPHKLDVGLTMAALRLKVIERVWAGSKGETRQVYLSSRVVDAIGRNVQVKDVSASVIDRYIVSLEAKRNANGTINRSLAVLSRMLTFAHSREYIVAVPHVAFKPAPKSRERYLSLDEEAKVLALLKLWSQDDVHDLVVFLLDTGCRVGEALKLTWRDVAGDYRRATFRDTKNGTTRTVPLTQRVADLLSRRCDTGSIREPFALRYHNVEILWRQVREHLGLGKDKHFVIHMLRHTCASRLVQRGARIQEVMVWLGHKKIQQTMQYSHLAPESLDALTALLEQQPAPTCDQKRRPT